MKSRIYILGLVLLSFFSGKAQQLPQYTQYMLNEMAINPAVAGKEDYTDVRSNNRYQWVGITDSPRTYMLTANGPIKGKNMGLGMHLYTDIVGPTRRTGLNFAYAYHIKVKEDMFVSMGLSAGILQWGIDGSKLILHDEGDANLLTSYKTKIVPDFGTGVYFYKKNRFYVGVAVPQIYEAPINIYVDKQSNSKIVRHFNINGAYKFDIDDDFKVEPSFVMKYAKPAPLVVDLSVRGIYQEQVWLGVGYRSWIVNGVNSEAFTAMVGYMYKDYLMFGYSYDFCTTNIKKYSTGTHEIMLGLRFSRKQASTWEAKK
ncbi:MAG: type IX secretion system membrane protein PorP/SprF [Sphingobacteriaceae bacterium]|jgi:type IX secretion system PorP/SprF family membrane protein|nr:type IX secretion system membrane protein PorP/SprF [Sphingobacteriaceae bacterium]